MKIVLIAIGTALFALAAMGCDVAENGKASIQAPNRPKAPKPIATATSTATTPESPKTPTPTDPGAAVKE